MKFPRVLLPILASALGSSLFASDHLSIVQRYADAIIDHGTDTYGEVGSGMLLSMMARQTLRAFGKMPKGPSGVRNGDRVTTHGSNVNLDQDLYRVLYSLSEITGDHENVTRADTLALALLKLHAVENSLPVELPISDIER